MGSFTQIFTLVISALGGGTLVALINNYAQRKKVSAEARNLDVTGEVALGDGWKSYAQTLRNDLDSLRAQMQGMEERHKKEIDSIRKQFMEENALLRSENLNLLREIKHMRKENIALRSTINHLEEELDKVKVANN